MDCDALGALSCEDVMPHFCRSLQRGCAARSIGFIASVHIQNTATDKARRLGIEQKSLLAYRRADVLRTAAAATVKCA